MFVTLIFQVTPLLLSALKVKWKGIYIHTFCNYSPTAKIPQLLDHAWLSVCNEVEADVKEIFKDSACYFCQGCSSQCKNVTKPWHMDVNDFVEVKYLDNPTGYGTLNRQVFNLNIVSRNLKYLGLNVLMQLFWFCSISLFNEYANAERPQGVMVTIQNFRNRKEPGTLKGLFKDLRENAVGKQADYFSTYLVLLLNSPTVDLHQNKYVTEMLSDTDVIRCVYVGRCKNSEIRPGHFHCSTSLNVLMSANSRLFFIRKRRWPNQQEAELDEAIVLVSKRSLFGTSQILQKYEKILAFVFRKS